MPAITITIAGLAQAKKVNTARIMSEQETPPISRCFVYVLGSRSDNGIRTYVGWTTDLARRLAAHNNGTGARSTRGRQWELLYAECYLNKSDAMRREWHLKRDRRFRATLRLSVFP